MIGHKLIRMVRLTRMMELMTLTVTMMVSVTLFGPSQGMGCGVCAMFFQGTLYLTRDLMEDAAAPSNLPIPTVSHSDRAATFARAKKIPKPGEHIQLFRMKRDRNKGFYFEKC